MNHRLADRFEQIDQVFETMNREALQVREIPFVRREAYLHYCNVKTFLQSYTRKLRPDADTFFAWLDFVYEDTRLLKNRIGSLDLYAFTFYYLKLMTFRTGNLDTPDDCVEILHLDLFLPYMRARQKEWRQETLTPDEYEILEKHVSQVLACMKDHLPPALR